MGNKTRKAQQAHRMPALFEDFWLNRVCRGDRVQYEWLTGWMASVVQKPAEWPDAAQAVRSWQPMSERDGHEPVPPRQGSIVTALISPPFNELPALYLWVLQHKPSSTETLMREMIYAQRMFQAFFEAATRIRQGKADCGVCEADLGKDLDVQTARHRLYILRLQTSKGTESSVMGVMCESCANNPPETIELLVKGEADRILNRKPG